MISSNSKIIIVGAGVFGLSTALWLKKAGYKNVTVFDRCPFDKNNYNPADGCDGASADINKIYRATYGTKKEYQALALEAREMWLAWDKDIQATPESELPAAITHEDKMIDFCGLYYLNEGSKLWPHYATSLETTAKEAPEFRKLQFVKGNAEDENRLRAIDEKWVTKYHILDKVNGGLTSGVIDIGAGINLADKACAYALHLCKQAGVELVLGDTLGNVERLLIEGSDLSKRAIGIKTCDGQMHLGDLVIVASGPWTATIIPEACGTVEAAAGTVMFIDVPEDRKDIREKFHPRNFPVWSYRKGEGNNYYQGGGFPITREGRLKFGFLGRKYTNFQDHPTQPSLRISTPRTKYTKDPITTVPIYGLRRMKEVIGQAFPELKEFGFTDSRLCWYTETPGDDDMIIDYVPGYSDSLFVCTGHGFKFLPNLGKYVKNQLERVPDQFTEHWKWRAVSEGKVDNGLGEGEYGPREISKFEMAERKDFQFQKSSQAAL